MRTSQPPLHHVIATHAALIEENNRIRLEAAERTRHFFNTKYSWSPEWQAYKRPVCLWKLAIKRFHGRVNGRFFRRLMNECKEPDAHTLTEDQCKAKLIQAEDEFNFACTRSETLRQEFVKNLAKALAKKNNTSEESEYKKLTNISKQKKGQHD